MYIYYFLGLYLIVINAAGFFTMALDKKRSRQGAWRIPEKTLFLIALAGGSPGSIAGMYHFRHKTKHKAFVLGMPIILIIQLILIILLRYYGIK